MARFARIDSQIRANRLILANRFRVPELNPLFANGASGDKNENRRFEAIRANSSHVVKVGVFQSRRRRASAIRARILFLFRIGNLCSIFD